MRRRRVLFLCTGNSSRSQMAEGLLRDLASDRIEVLSAGTNPAGFIHPLAVAAMREIGIDVTKQGSKSIHTFLPPAGKPPDLLISLCDSAARLCPPFPADVERLHWPFDDPGHVAGSDDERLNAFRETREQIRAALQEHFGTEAGS